MSPTRESRSSVSTDAHPVSAPQWLWIGFWLCIAISVAVVIRRVIALAFPSQSGPPQMAELNRLFASHTALTMTHILPALAFVIVAPFIVLRRFSHLAWPERVLFPLGAIVGLTAYAMSTYSIGGWIERSAVLFFNTLFLFSLGRAWLFKIQGQFERKRRWLLRAVGILLGIATTRPVMGVFFATSAATHLTPQRFFGFAFWIGFSINWIVVESWLHNYRPILKD
ncbi:MAG TPA: DUF2306 domain-containing protein [Terracidiphilus sp.]|nr:DUF2306 domain-containing protein [Terracidiphilus sp.]